MFLHLLLNSHQLFQGLDIDYALFPPNNCVLLPVVKSCSLYRCHHLAVNLVIFLFGVIIHVFIYWKYTHLISDAIIPRTIS